MIQSAFDASSNGSESSTAAQYTSNTGFHMNQFHWLQPGHFPQPGFHYPAPNATPGATPRLATVIAPPPVPQIPGSSAGIKKRGTQDLCRQQTKLAKTIPSEIRNDTLFRPVLDEHGQYTGKFVCSKDGTVLNPRSYLKHTRTAKHKGYNQERFQCPVCSRTYARHDARKRHFDTSKCGKAVAGGPPPSFSAEPASTSSGVVAPVMVPTMSFTYSHPYSIPSMPMPQHVQAVPPAAGVPQPLTMSTCAVPEPCLHQPDNNTVLESAEDDDEDDDANIWAELSSFIRF